MWWKTWSGRNKWVPSLEYQRSQGARQNHLRRPQHSDQQWLLHIEPLKDLTFFLGIIPALKGEKKGGKRFFLKSWMRFFLNPVRDFFLNHEWAPYAARLQEESKKQEVRIFRASFQGNALHPNVTKASVIWDFVNSKGKGINSKFSPNF